MCKTAKIAIHNVLGTKNVNNINHGFNNFWILLTVPNTVLNLWEELKANKNWCIR